MFTVKLACYTWKSVESLIYLDQPCQNIRPSLGAMQSAVTFHLNTYPFRKRCGTGAVQDGQNVWWCRDRKADSYSVSFFL